MTTTKTLSHMMLSARDIFTFWGFAHNSVIIWFGWIHWLSWKPQGVNFDSHLDLHTCLQNSFEISSNLGIVYKKDNDWKQMGFPRFSRGMKFYNDNLVKSIECLVTKIWFLLECAWHLFVEILKTSSNSIMISNDF
jgi:hypothetical protein